MNPSEMLWVEHLAWDSEFFGIKIGQLCGRGNKEMLHELVANSIAADFKCLYSLVDCDDSRMVYSLPRCGFSLVDVRIELARDVADPIRQAEAYQLYLGTEADVEQLTSAARGTFSKSRFYSDPHFPKDRCDQLYDEWIRRDCTTEDRFTVVAKCNGQLAGFWSASITGSVGQTGLGFVSPDFRGKGVPAAMSSYMSDQLERCGVGLLKAATQGSNVAAVRMHLNCGFKFTGTKLWYHAWL